MRSLGHTVLGADQNTYPPMSDRLAAAGIDILPGFNAERLKALQPDLVVVGNVNTRGNPEIEWLLRRREIPFVSLPELLAREVLEQRRTIVVAGTHGKTTTSAMAATLLRASGIPAGYLIGGVPLDLPSGADAGEPTAPFVIEGDEYDSAFFDKRSKFIHYCPSILVLNNIEFDHADIFRDLEDVQRSFRHLVKLVPDTGWILANADDPNVEELLEVDWCRILRVGCGDSADLRLEDIRSGEQGSSCRLNFQGRDWGVLQLSMHGLFNLRNAAMSALAAALASGAEADPTAFAHAPLSGVRGVRRRQECLFQDKAHCLISDFAHHPSAVRETLMALRQRFPGHDLIACMEARSNTTCRKIHERSFEEALAEADEVHFGAVFRAERYPQGDRIDFSGMARRLGKKATAHEDNERLLAALQTREQGLRPEVIVFFSNGSFDGIERRFKASLMAPKA